MALVRVSPGQDVEDSHINQFVDYLEGGVGGVGGAIPFTNDSATDYTVTLKNNNASDRTFRILNNDGSERLRVNANGIYSPDNIYIGEDGISGGPDVNHKLIVNHSAGAGTTISDLFSSELYIDPGASHDAGAILGFVMHTSAGGTVTLRALAGQMVKYSVTGAADVECLELGMHNGKDMTAHADNPSVYDTYFGSQAINIVSHVDVQGEGNTGVRNNTAVTIWGAAGWKRAILYYDTDQSTKLYEVNEDGRVIQRGPDVHTGILTPSAIGANQNNYTSGAEFYAKSIVQLSASAPYNITGLSSTGVIQGQVMTLVNIGSNTITLTHNDGASSAANRFALPGSANFSLTAGTAIRLYWDASLWRAFA